MAVRSLKERDRVPRSVVLKVRFRVSETPERR
jgi:ribosomal protein L39E